jgi:hypothetical protein
MNKILSLIMVAVISLSLIYTPVAFAGDIVPAGTTLDEESYVFTIDEATRLLQRVEDLEIKEQELIRYQQLDILRSQQIDLYKLNIDYSRTQLDYYSSLASTNQNLIDRYNKRDRLHNLENIGFLILGIALTAGAFVAADSITDQMEAN